MNILIIHNKPDFAAQIEYTFDILLSSIGLTCELFVWPNSDVGKAQLDDCPVILYGGDALDAVLAQRSLRIYSSDFFGSHYLTTASLPDLPLDWVLVDKKRLPIIYCTDNPLAGKTVLVSVNGNPIATQSPRDADLLLSTNLDLVASSFFMLSRYEEALSQERDVFNRFPLEADLAFRAGFCRTPIVNLYARLLGEWIKTITNCEELEPRPPSYPNGHSFGLCLTHDVDNPRKFTPIGLLKTVAKVMLRRQGLEGLKQIEAYLSARRDPFWNFDQIIGLEQAHGFRSTFFLIAGQRHEYDPPYGNDSVARARLCKTILDLGGEIGLHGSFESYLNAEILGNELANLSQYGTVNGGRQHYLRLDAQRTFAVMEQVGLLYDCTLGFSRELGFRSGFAGPHYVFNLDENRPFRILEIPLLIMDRSMWDGCCRGMTSEAVWSEMLQVLEPVRDYNGCMSVLWHNGFFDDAAFPGYSDLYRSLLSWLRENNGWGTSGGEVYEWFVANQRR